MIKKNSVYAKLLCIFFIFTGALYSSEITSQALYDGIRKAQMDMYPKYFQSEVRGTLVSKQIETIPSTYHTGGKPRLMYKYTKNGVSGFVLENVTSFYVKMFSVFEPILDTTAVYTPTTKLKSYSAFSKKYSVTSISESGDKIIARVVQRDEDKDYTIEYTINKETFLIEDAKYYLKNKIIYNLSITYQNVDEYTIPEKIIYKSSDSEVDSFIEFYKPSVK